MPKLGITLYYPYTQDYVDHATYCPLLLAVDKYLVGIILRIVLEDPRNCQSK